MEDTIEELYKKIKMDTEVSFAVSDVGSLIPSESEQGTPSGDGSSSPQYTHTLLTEGSVPTMEELFYDQYPHTISNDNVLAQLDEILLLLIAVRGGSCGKELLQDLRFLFGADLSPGTVYPHLINLADEDALDVTKLPKQKKYQISDVESTIDMVAGKVDQLVMFSLVLKALTIDCRALHSQPSRGETDER